MMILTSFPVVLCKVSVGIFHILKGDLAQDKEFQGNNLETHNIKEQQIRPFPFVETLTVFFFFRGRLS